MKTLALSRLKRARAVELLTAGKSYDEIAREVGFTHRGSAHRAVSKALADREVEAVDQFRSVELDRLDQLHEAMWPAAMAGEIDAIEGILKIVDRRIRLLGLNLSRPQ